jgi:hypothetical protein
MIINSISDFRRAVRNGPYVWPGGYPLYWIMADGEACAFDVAKSERRNMLAALRDKVTNNYPAKDWLPVALDVNWEDSSLTCAHTGKPIESAYGANLSADMRALIVDSRDAPATGE